MYIGYKTFYFRIKNFYLLINENSFMLTTGSGNTGIALKDLFNKNIQIYKEKIIYF